MPPCPVQIARLESALAKALEQSTAGMAHGQVDLREPGTRRGLARDLARAAMDHLGGQAQAGRGDGA